VGFSHDVNVPEGRTEMVRVDGELVEDVLEIASASSVDFVLNPAAGGQFLEHEEEVNMAELKELRESLDKAKTTIAELQTGQRVADARGRVAQLLEGVADLPTVAKHRITDNVIDVVRMSEDVKVDDLVKNAAETERKYLAEIAKPAQPDNAGNPSSMQLLESRQELAASIYQDMCEAASFTPLQVGGAV